MSFSLTELANICLTSCLDDTECCIAVFCWRLKTGLKPSPKGVRCFATVRVAECACFMLLCLTKRLEEEVAGALCQFRLLVLLRMLPFLHTGPRGHSLWNAFMTVDALGLQTLVNESTR